MPLSFILTVSLWGLAHAGVAGFTTNRICKQHSCVNPLFPAVNDLYEMSQTSFACQKLKDMEPFLGFCRGAVNYPPAVPQPDAESPTAADQAKKMQQRALTMFAYHLSAMGMEYWDYKKPALSDDPCVQSVWRLACYTYFPKSPAGCDTEEVTEYMRPCKRSCTNYLNACQVECCDESVQCVFTNTETVQLNQNETKTITKSGYSDIEGPSLLCTGSASRCGAFGAWVVIAVASLFSGNRVIPLSMAALAVQGWDISAPTHKVGNWRGQPDYLVRYQFIPPGADATGSILNSCSKKYLAQTLQCSGRGKCKTWDTRYVDNPVTFCECSVGWADPECRTERKSQVTAFFLSLLLGPLGADQFYLGFPIAGSLKLVTLGGLGAWWLVDIIRIGSAPVYAWNYRVSADLPHWAYVIATILTAFCLGVLIATYSISRNIRAQRKATMLLRSDPHSMNNEC